MPMGLIGSGSTLYNLGWLQQTLGVTTTITKIINIALAQPVTADVWSFLSNAGTPNEWLCTTAMGGPTKRIIIPLLLPHRSTLKNVTVRVTNSAAEDNDGHLEVYKEAWNGTKTLLGVSTAFDPVGAPADVTMAADITEVVDLETYEYYIDLDTGFDTGGARTQELLAAKVKFEYNDHMNVPE
jgi:hypothetical protein